MFAGRCVLALEADAAGEIALRIGIDEQDALVGQGEGRAEVDGGGGLADAAFLICDREDLSHYRSINRNTSCSAYARANCKNITALPGFEGLRRRYFRRPLGLCEAGCLPGRTFHVEHRGTNTSRVDHRPGGTFHVEHRAADLEHLAEDDQATAERLDERPGGLIDQRRSDQRRRFGPGCASEQEDAPPETKERLDLRQQLLLNRGQRGW